MLSRWAPPSWVLMVILLQVSGTEFRTSKRWGQNRLALQPWNANHGGWSHLHWNVPNPPHSRFSLYSAKLNQPTLHSHHCFCYGQCYVQSRMRRRQSPAYSRFSSTGRSPGRSSCWMWYSETQITAVTSPEKKAHMPMCHPPHPHLHHQHLLAFSCGGPLSL